MSEAISGPEHHLGVDLFWFFNMTSTWSIFCEGSVLLSGSVIVSEEMFNKTDTIHEALQYARCHLKVI